MSSSSFVTDTLENILNFTASVDPELRQCLREGLSAEQIHEMTQDFGFCLPKEVKALYKWHNGMESKGRERHRLLYYHYFLPLDEALDLHRYFTKNYPIERKGLLPLFEFEGEYYATCCEDKEQDQSPIVFLYHDESLVYNSLTTMLASILECYEKKAYIPILCSDGEPSVDEELAAQIKLKWNPIRGDLYNHP